MRKVNKFIVFGLLINSLTLSLKYFGVNLPDFFSGLGLGMGTSLLIVGAYLERTGKGSLWQFKRNLFRKAVDGNKPDRV